MAKTELMKLQWIQIKTSNSVLVMVVATDL